MIGNILKVIATLIKGCLVGLLFGSTIGILLGLPLGFFFREIVSSNQDVPLRILLSIILGGLLGFSEVQIFNKKLFAADEHPLIGILVGAVFGLTFGGLVNNVMVVLSSDSSNQDFYVAGLIYSGALGVRIGAIMYSFFGVAEAVREIVKHHQSISGGHVKKRWFLLVPIILLLMTGSSLVIKGQFVKMYAACRTEMLAMDGYGPWTYQRTSLFPPPIAIIFDDGTNIAECQVQWKGSEWQVISVWETLVGCLNCPEGKFGVIP